MKSRNLALSFFVVSMLSVFVYAHFVSNAATVAVEVSEVSSSDIPDQKQTQRKRTPRGPRVDYSAFSHLTLAHRRSCNECHKFPSSNWKEVRKGDAAFPDVTDFPQHASCIGCHAKQFFSGAQPAICSNCHVNVTPRNGTRYPFPSLGIPFLTTSKGQSFVSDFNVSFPHDKHIEIVGDFRPEKTGKGTSFVNATFRQDDAAAKSCVVCHQTYQPQGKSKEEYVTTPPKTLGEDDFWLKKGAFKTHPFNHETCFTCHNQESGVAPAPTECNICHKLSEGPKKTVGDFDLGLASTMGITDNVMLSLWRERNAGAFRHEFEVHADLACATCHNVATMNTADERSRRPSVLSCGGTGSGCHITTTLDDGGILNFYVDKRKTEPSFPCTKCHVIFGKQPTPKSHLAALEEIKKK